MALHNFVCLATHTMLVQHGTADGGAGSVVAPLGTAVPPTWQQLVAGAATRQSLLITCQRLILHLASRVLVICEPADNIQLVDKIVSSQWCSRHV